MTITAFRSLAYALIATGFINMTYQHSHSNIYLKSGLSIAVGILYLLISLNTNLKSLLNSKRTSWIFIGIALLALVIQFLN